MLVGASVGKTTCINHFLEKILDKEKFVCTSTLFTAQTRASQMQANVEVHLCKVSEETYGPCDGKRLVFFVDDVNMVPTERYGSQPSLEILRQFLFQGGWYDLENLTFKSIDGLDLIAAMGGMGLSGNALKPVSPRFLRWFHVLSVTEFDKDTVCNIYVAIANIRSNMAGAPSLFKELTGKLVKATFEIYEQCTAHFLPSPANPHYLFSTGDVGKVIIGLSAMDVVVTEQNNIIRHWVHETAREFFDRLTSDVDRNRFADLIRDVAAKHFGVDLYDMLTDPAGDGGSISGSHIERLLFGDFDTMVGIRKYCELCNPLEAFDRASRSQRENDAKSHKPPLFLFAYAIMRATHICRVLRTAAGNALLLGVPGAGRYSCATLASYIMGTLVIKIEPFASSFGVSDWREPLKAAVRSAGIDARPTVLYFADRQIQTELILEDICALLRKYEMPFLLADERADWIKSSGKSEMLGGGSSEELAAAWSVLQENCRCNLHILVSLGGVGGKLQGYLRQFPSLLNCCTISWFGEWPTASLSTLAKEFLSDSSILPEMQENFIAASVRIHEIACNVARIYSRETLSCVHLVPSSFLAFLQSFAWMLRRRRASLDARMEVCAAANRAMDQVHRTADALKISLYSQQLQADDAQLGQVSSFLAALDVEKGSWQTAERDLAVQIANLPGNLLLASAYLSYLGVFSMEYR